MEDLYERIAAIKSLDHYFSHKSSKLEEYREGFVQNVKPLAEIIGRREFGRLLNNKLLFDKEFNEKKYIQYACETTVVSYFAMKYGENFKYDVKLNKSNSKDVECQFKFENFTYNIEVKCPTFDSQERQDLENNFLFHTPIKMDRELPDALISALNEVVPKHMGSESNTPKYVMPHYMELNLKEYLLGANEKFKEAPDSDNINILIVCCGNGRTMQEFLYYLKLQGGFFNEDPDVSIASPIQYEKVDAVVLCNLYHRHAKYFDKSHLLNHWSLSDSFTLIFDNVHGLKSESKIHGISKFIYEILPNHTEDFIYFMYNGDWVKEFDGLEHVDFQLREILGLERYIDLLPFYGFNYF